MTTNDSVAADRPLVVSACEQADTNRLGVAMTLTFIVAASAALRIVLGSMVSVPTIFPDELGFWELGRGVGESGRWQIGGQPVTGFTYAPLYPLLIAPIHLVTSSLVDAYALTKALNAVVMSLAAVPAYFLARRVVSARGALASAALAVLVPSAVYTTHVMSESLSYPLFLCSMVAMAAAISRPGPRRELIALSVLVLTALSRTQLAVLFLAFACAILLVAFKERALGDSGSIRRRLWSFKTTWLTYAAGLLVLVLFGFAGDLVRDTRETILRSLGGSGSLPTGLPSFSQLRPLVGPVHLQAVPGNVLRHVADLDLYSGVIPFAVFVLLVFGMLRSRGARGAGLHFLALSLSVGAWIVVLSAIYETTFKLHGISKTHVYDRYTFYLVPLFVIAVVIWVEEGLPRPRRSTVAVGVAAGLLPLALPPDRLLNGYEWGTSTSTVGLVPLVWAKDVVGSEMALSVLLLCATCALALVFMRISPARGAVVLPLCAAVFVLSTIAVTASNTKLATAVSQSSGWNALAWVDQSLGSTNQVAIVWRGNAEQPPPERSALREAVFFNRRIGPVYDLGTPLAPGYPSTQVATRQGRVITAAGSPVRARYVLADRSLGVVGQPIAADRGSGLVLYRVSGPVRLDP